MEIIGWRAWYVVQVGVGTGAIYRLQSLGSGGSVTFRSLWRPGQAMQAKCDYFDTYGTHRGTVHGGGMAPHYADVSDPRVPNEGCSCGFYSAATREDLVRYGYPSMAVNGRDPGTDVFGKRKPSMAIPGGKIVGAAIGQVAQAGRVVPATQGWRSEQVWATHLWIPRTMWKLARPLAEQYGIVVECENILAQKGVAV